MIEDDAAVRQLLAVNLRNEGFEPLEAADGESGLALARDRDLGLVLLDLRLPGIDGFAVLQELKKAPATAEVPVIAMTGAKACASARGPASCRWAPPISSPNPSRWTRCSRRSAR